MIAAIRLADLQYGTYLDVPDGHTECAIRPSDDHVLGDNWQTDPLNESVCWRVKTQIEIDAEVDAEKDRNVDFANVDIFLKALTLALNDGSFVSGSSYTNEQIKTIIKNKM